jgi:hypothetical protein
MKHLMKLLSLSPIISHDSAFKLGYKNTQVVYISRPASASTRNYFYSNYIVHSAITAEIQLGRYYSSISVKNILSCVNMEMIS